MTDHSTMKLGKRARRHDARTLKLARYLTPELPQPPASVDYARGLADWGVMLNDRLGCCTVAAVGHAVQTWTMNAGSRVDFCDEAVRLYYEKWDGYNPADPATDRGGVELDVLNRWRRDGFAGHRLDAFAAVSVKANPHPVEFPSAVWLFGGAYIGVELPVRAQRQDVWDVPASPGPDDTPGSWGGHAVFINAYDEFGLTCITWGRPKKMTWKWFDRYCSEAYALVSKDWIQASGLAPSGFNLAALEQDLKAVTSEE